jgi:aromatase
MMPSTSHAVLCSAPPERIYRIISDSARWPDLFEPCLEVRALERDCRGEDIEVAAMINGAPMRWRSRRRFRPDALAIDSESVEPMPLVRSMKTRWRVIPANEAQCALVLEHDFEVLDDVAGLVEGVGTAAEAAAFIARAIEANSLRELANIRDSAAPGSQASDGTGPIRRFCSIVCEAPALQVFEAVADTGQWPLLFDACASVEVLEDGARGELVRIEARQGDRLISWTTRRRYHRDLYRIDFTLETPMPFVAAMAGEWRVTPLGPDRALLSVDRRFELRETPDQPRDEILRFLDENAETEMLAVKSLVETGDAAFTMARSRHILPFAPDRVYRVLAQVHRWPEILPSCGVTILYDDGLAQEFTMEIAGSAGVENFRSVRLCDPRALSITYFQPSPPPWLASHHGSWTVRGVAQGSEIVAERRVRIDAARCAEAFGEPDLARNKARVRETITANTAATVKACADWLARTADDANG